MALSKYSLSITSTLLHVGLLHLKLRKTFIDIFESMGNTKLAKSGHSSVDDIYSTWLNFEELK